MFTKLRNHFGIPGILAIAALVFAMIGGAYAATDPSGGKATASAKGKKGPRGKRGKRGKRGPAGPMGPVGAAGAQGPAGAKGDKGDRGDNGTQGQQGPTGEEGPSGDDGKSVITNTFTKEDEEAGDPPLEPCDLQGGQEVEEEGSGTPEFICNGEPGAPGPPGIDGQPWAPDNTLPEGATLTGAWSFNATTADGTLYTEFGEGPQAYAPISFPIKLAAALPEANVHVQGETDFATNCSGGTVATPAAAEEHLCVYRVVSNIVNATFAAPFGGKPFLEMEGSGGGASPTGTMLLFDVTGNPASGFGSWAVTGFDPTP